MSIKIPSSQVAKNRNIFSRLQYLGFSALVNSGHSEGRGHLDIESQEIIFKLKNNISELADLSGRMEFMMTEIQSVIKR